MSARGRTGMASAGQASERGTAWSRGRSRGRSLHPHGVIEDLLAVGRLGQSVRAMTAITESRNSVGQYRSSTVAGSLTTGFGICVSAEASPEQGRLSS